MHGFQNNAFLPRGLLGVLALALLLCGCGPGGNPYTGSNGTGTNGPPPPTAAVPGLSSDGDLRKDATVYRSTGYAQSPLDPKQIDAMYVAVLEPADPSGPCNDGIQADVDAGKGRGPVTPGKKNYSGCTLADVNADVDNQDAYKPVVNVIFSAADYVYTDSTPNATLGIRGGSSRLARLKSYKIKIYKGQPKWRGQRTIQLNKGPDDLSRVRQKLSFDLFREVPDFASLRTTFVHLRLADISAGATVPARQTFPDFGLFVQLEKVDDDWADAHGLDEDSNIFKSKNFAFLPAGNNADCSAFASAGAPAKPCLEYPQGTIPFELAIESKGDNEDTSVFFRMLTAVNDNFAYMLVNYPDPFAPVMAQYFHEDNFVTWLATEILLGNPDSVNNNFYLYRPTPVDNFYFVPWDYDKGYDQVHQGGSTFAVSPTWHGVSHWWQVPLVRRYLMMNDGAGAATLTKKIKELYNGALSPAKARAVLDSYPLCANQDLSDDGKPLCPEPPASSPNDIEAMLLREPDISDMDAHPSTRSMKIADITPAVVAQVQAQWQTDVKRLPGTIATTYKQYNTNLDRPMPMFLGVEPVTDDDGKVVPGKLNLTWDPSWSAFGRTLSYDVALSDSPALGGVDPNCTQLGGVKQLATPTVGPESFTDPDTVHRVDTNEWIWPVALPAGTYYFRVIARDSEGYCQIPFDLVQSGSNGRDYYGVFAFKYDPSAGPDGQIEILSTDS